MDESGDNFFKTSRKELEQYVRDRIWLLKLQGGEKTARLVALLMVLLLIGVLTGFILLFLSVMAGYYFAGVTGSIYAGFGILAGVYLVLLILLLLSRKWLGKQVMNIVIRILFTQNDPDDDEED